MAVLSTSASLIEKHSSDLLIATDTGLKSVNVQNPSQPLPNFSMDINGYIEDVEIDGDYLYVVTDGGISIYSYSSGETPALLGLFKTQYAKKIVVKENRAYITNYYDGLQIVDITDKRNPIIDTFFERQTAIDLVVDGDYVYLLTSKYGLSVLDISQRRATMVKEFKVENFTSLLKDGDKLYISNEYKGLYILDVSNPSTPKFLSRTLTKATNVVKNDSTLQVLNRRLSTVEKIDEVTSSIVDYQEVPQIVSFDSDGEYIYTINLQNELEIIDNSGKTLFADGVPTGTTKSISVELTKGWNLIGNPNSGDFGTASLSSDIKNIVSYKNGEWAVNSAIISVNEGFWVYSTDSTTVEFTGEPTSPNLLNITDSSWHLLSTGLSLAPEIGTTYIYNSGQWTKNPETISPAQGFWFKR